MNLKQITPIFNNITNTFILSNDYKLKYQKFLGIIDFDQINITTGITQSIDIWLMKNKIKTLNLFVGEYSYYQNVAKFLNMNINFIKHINQIKEGILAISFPFCDNGCFQNIDEILNYCDVNDIKVFLDLAYYGTTKKIKIPNNNCIDVIAHSMHKIIPVFQYRCGIRFTKKYDDDPIELLNQNNHLPFLGMNMAYNYILHNDINSLYEKYRIKQISICNKLKIIPSDSIIMGYSFDKFKEFNRGNEYSRICLSTLY
jgi:hypothetical protein